MKFNRWFILGITLFLVLLFIAKYNMPRDFNWTPTFDHDDRQPFGCFVFDSIVSQTMPQGYQVSEHTLYRRALDSTPRGILVVTKDLTLTKTDVKSLFKLAHDGSHIMLVCGSLDPDTRDTLGIGVWTGFFSSMKNYTKKQHERDTLRWVSRRQGYKPRDYHVLPPLLSSHILLQKDAHDRLNNRRIIDQQTWYDDSPGSVTIQEGRGLITVCSTPLLLTNYGMLDQDNAGYIFRMLSLMKDLPVVRTQAYAPHSDANEQTPLRYFLSQPPLRWALYLTVGGCLLFLVFTARRRQRVIPIENEPENHSMEFIQLVGSLYAHSRQRRSLVLRKYTYFAEELRRNIHIDITDADDDAEEQQTIARMTGIDESDIARLISDMRRLQADDEKEISTRQMKQYIDRMNQILQNLL